VCVSQLSGEVEVTSPLAFTFVKRDLLLARTQSCSRRIQHQKQIGVNYESNYETSEPNWAPIAVTPRIYNQIMKISIEKY
jgi:hypothetical protein